MNKVVLLSLTLILAATGWAKVDPRPSAQPESVAVFQNYLGLSTSQLVELEELRTQNTPLARQLAREVLTEQQKAMVDALAAEPADEPLRARAEYFLFVPVAGASTR